MNTAKDTRAPLLRRNRPGSEAMAQETDICKYMANRSENDLLIDIRDETSYRLGTIPGAINIPIRQIRQLYALPKGRDIYVFCQTGEVSGEIAELLSDAGCSAWNLTGGYRKYLRNQMKKGAD